jgi:enterochelin esterase family protein
MDRRPETTEIPVAYPAGPSLDPRTGAVTFVVADTEGVVPQRVWYHLRDFGDDPTFRREDGRWVARVPAPPVDRIEYLLVVRTTDGEATALDPANPLRVDGVFGELSVLELPGYHRPAWVSAGTAPWHAEPVVVGTADPRLAVEGELLTPPGVADDTALPLLVVHDGPEYVRLARLLDHLHWLAAGDRELRCRVLSLRPVDRDRAYAASPAYTQALVERALPQAAELAPVAGTPLGLGASLGGLALAHAAATYPGSFAGLLCQSGSFFLERYDAHERRWRYFDDVLAATRALHADPSPLAGVAVRLTAGLGEENLENNRALATRLAALGVDASIVEGRSGHSFTAWRDLLHPTLGALIALCWNGSAGG